MNFNIKGRKNIVWANWTIVKDDVAVEQIFLKCYKNRDDEEYDCVGSIDIGKSIDNFIGVGNWDYAFGEDLDKHSVCIMNELLPTVVDRKLDTTYTPIYNVYNESNLLGQVDLGSCLIFNERITKVEEKFGNDWTSVRHKDLPVDSTCKMIKNGDTLSYL